MSGVRGVVERGNEGEEEEGKRKRKEREAKQNERNKVNSDIIVATIKRLVEWIHCASPVGEIAFG